MRRTGSDVRHTPDLSYGVLIEQVNERDSMGRQERTHLERIIDRVLLLVSLTRRNQVQECAELRHPWISSLHCSNGGTHTVSRPSPVTFESKNIGHTDLYQDEIYMSPTIIRKRTQGNNGPVLREGLTELNSGLDVLHKHRRFPAP